MGSVQSQSVKQNTEVANKVLQSSNMECAVSCSSEIENSVFIATGGGDININNSCKMNDIGCTINNYFQSDISTILDNMAKQNTSAQTGLSFDFHASKQTININQLIENSITQLQQSSCYITANQKINNVIAYTSEGGNININNEGSISSSSCKLDNTAKAEADSTATTDTEQTSKYTSIFNSIFTIIIICIIVGAIVAIVSAFKPPEKGVTPPPPTSYSPTSYPPTSYPPPSVLYSYAPTSYMRYVQPSPSV